MLNRLFSVLFQQTPTDGSHSVYDNAKISANFLIDIGTLSQLPNLKTIFAPSYHP